MGMQKVVANEVRGHAMNFVAYTRSLELCARMNYETEILDFIDGIPSGSVFYDLGACEGRFSIYAALRGIGTFAFEPDESNYVALQQNIALNAVALRSFPLAVGDAEYTSKLRIGQPWAGGHQKVIASASRVDLDFPVVKEIDVRVVSLDAFIAEQQLPGPQYMKVDIDGSEGLFLSGAAKTLRDLSLRALVFELSRRDGSYAHAIEFLRCCGFHVGAHHSVPNEPELFNVVFER